MHGITAARKPFQPTDIPNCVVWLRADLGVVIGTGNRIARWQNQGSGGSAFDGTAHGGTGPLYSASGGLNNQAHIIYDTSAFLDWGYTNYLGAKTIVVVFKMDTIDGSGQTLYVISQASIGASELIVDLSAYTTITLIDDWVVGGTMFGDSSVALGTTAGHISLHTYDGSGTEGVGNYTMSTDGVSKTVAVSGAYAYASTSAIGFRGNSTFPLKGKISELIVIERVCNAVEQLQLVGYLRNRYAL